MRAHEPKTTLAVLVRGRAAMAVTMASHRHLLVSAALVAKGERGPINNTINFSHMGSSPCRDSCDAVALRNV